MVRAFLFSVLFVFSACGASRGALTPIPGSEPNLVKAQPGGAVPQDAEPGKCYHKVSHNGFLVWQEVLCESQITKSLVKQIQMDLVRHDYVVDAYEMSAGTLGPSTKEALKAFQIANDMAAGGLTQSVIDRLKRP